MIELWKAIPQKWKLGISLFIAIFAYIAILWDSYNFATCKHNVRLANEILMSCRAAVVQYREEHHSLPTDTAKKFPSELIGYYRGPRPTRYFGAVRENNDPYPIDPFFSDKLKREEQRENAISYLRGPDFTVFWSVGPDGKDSYDWTALKSGWDCHSVEDWEVIRKFWYDATNGVVSDGDLVNIVCDQESF